MFFWLELVFVGKFVSSSAIENKKIVSRIKKIKVITQFVMAFLFNYLVILKTKKMKTKTFLYIAVFGMLFASCNQEKSTKEYMTNSWETTYLKIDMKTYQKSDSTFVFEDDFKNNPPRRAQSKYKKDGSFSAWYINLKGEKKEESTGKWNVKKDSLFIEYFYGGRAVKVSYHIEKTEKGFTGKSKYDWDEDGNFDDILIMKTKRIQTEK